ncbi:MAG: hypothetical protein ACOCT9_02680 [archaeon]
MNFRNILADFKTKKVHYADREQKIMVEEIINNYENERYISVEVTGFVLYEKIFTTKLNRETSNPDDFKPSKENVSRQIENLIKREKEVVDERKLRFYDITEKLENLDILSTTEKEYYDDFYNKYRNPVLHGLSHRLYDILYDKRTTFIQRDLDIEKLHKEMSEKIIKKLHELYFEKSFYD